MGLSHATLREPPLPVCPQAATAGSSKSIESLGNDQKNKEIAVLVRGQLCTALSRVLLHGFKSFKLIGRCEIA